MVEVAWVEGFDVEEMVEVGESGSGDFGSSTGGGGVGRSGSLLISCSRDGRAFSRGLCKPNIRFFLSDRGLCTINVQIVLTGAE